MDLFDKERMLQEQAYLISDRVQNLSIFIGALSFEMGLAHEELRELLKQNPGLKLRHKASDSIRWFKTLVDFTIFCAKNPSLRFWQALRSWIPSNFILVSEKGTHDFQEHEQSWLDDTFYREGK